jgi:endo-1,4-beta-xylanase
VQSFLAAHAQGQKKAQIGLRVFGGTLAFRVNGQEVGRMDDPGLFPDGWVYTGANLPPGSAIALANMSLEIPQGAQDMVEITFSGGERKYQPQETSLRELAEKRNLYLGAAVSPTPLRCEPDYAAALAHEFNLATAENALKFGPVHPQPDQYAFEDADAIVEFALAHQMAVRGHVLVWHQQNPGWIVNGEWTKETLSVALEDHIRTVVGRYQGKILYWDVVNEAVEAGGLRDTLWLRTLGPEYLDIAFRWAHAADPEARLFYNDYGTEGLGAKSDQVYELVKGMLERGVPIHGVGLQLHIAVGSIPYGLQANMQRLADLGLEVHITELDVRIDGQVNEAKLQKQAATYRQVMEACLNVEGCTAYILWGFTDAYSWVPGQFKNWGSALPFDENYQPKPAYAALQEALQVNPAP